MTAREAGRAWAERVWSAWPGFHRATWESLFTLEHAIGYGWAISYEVKKDADVLYEAAAERWQELQRAADGATRGPMTTRRSQLERLDAPPEVTRRAQILLRAHVAAVPGFSRAFPRFVEAIDALPSLGPALRCLHELRPVLLDAYARVGWVPPAEAWEAIGFPGWEKDAERRAEEWRGRDERNGQESAGERGAEGTRR